MKLHFIPLIVLAFLAGCASVPNGGDNAASASGSTSVYNDPTYPGTGFHIGIGAGSWGGHSGGGVDFGMGW